MDSFYFCEYDEDDDEYIVYFGNNIGEFNAMWIAAFIREEDANEYVDFKNDMRERNPNMLSDEDVLIDPDWDEDTAEDLVTRFNRNYGDLKD